MKQKSGRKWRKGHAEPFVLLPPNLQTLGALPFTALDFARLDAWLGEDGWPPERMDIAMLEGYLVALLVWPIEISPGAWLPPVWGVRGWKVAAKIASPEEYATFLALVIGFLQELEGRLVASPGRPTPVLGNDMPYVSGQYFAGAAWATGFITALQQNSAGLRSRSVRARSAVEAIAHYASLRSTESSAMPAVATALLAAVATLLTERSSRGPLGPIIVNDPAMGIRPTVGPEMARLAPRRRSDHVGEFSK
jgi:yecA family protein